MLRIAGVTARDFVVDLGSGDGRIVITAAQKFGARGRGYDIDASMIERSAANARKAGVEQQVSFREEDVLKALSTSSSRKLTCCSTPALRAFAALRSIIDASMS